jgi:hypothetical protein
MGDVPEITHRGISVPSLMILRIWSECIEAAKRGEVHQVKYLLPTSNYLQIDFIQRVFYNCL